MKLKQIKDEICSICGSKVVAESCYYTHTNGEGFEERKFECGCVLGWNPNFSKLETKKKCPKSSEEVEKKQKRILAVKKTFDFIMKLDVDDEFKQKLGYDLQCMKTT